MSNSALAEFRPTLLRGSGPFEINSLRDRARAPERVPFRAVWQGARGTGGASRRKD